MIKQLLILMMLVSFSFGRITTDTVRTDYVRSNPDIDSTKGNTIHTGTYTVSSTVSVDSLKSTKGVNATGGTFSGAIVGTTLNTGNGANELYPMNQAVTTTSDVTFDSSAQRVITINNGDSAGIIVGPNTSFGATLRIGGWNINDARARIAVSNGNIHIDSDTSQQGVYINHYFPENVYIGVGGGEVDINKALADSIKLGTGSYLKTYVEGSFPCTLKTSDVTVQQVGTVGYTITGNIVTLSIPNIKGTSNSSTLILYCGSIPSTIEPSKYVNGSTMVFNSGGFDVGTWRYYSVMGKFFTFNMPGGAGFASSGTKGFGFAGFDNSTTITYTK